MKRKFLACAFISAATVSVAAFAGCGLFGGGSGGDDGSVVEQDNMSFTLKDDGTYELDRYLVYLETEEGSYAGSGETVTVPDTVNGKAVTSVDEQAFAQTAVKSVTLPDAISVLPDSVFNYCVYLDTVNLSTVTSVGKSAFSGCENLESIEFKNGLTEIGSSAFTDCPALKTVTLPDSVTTLGDRCFLRCPIESINTNGVEILGEMAFYYCENLTSLSLPNVKSIGEQAMRSCGKLAELSIGDKLEEYGDSVIYGCDLLTKISINSPVIDKMFQWNKVITDITLGEGVTSIGEMAFGYCTGIKNIVLPATLTDIGVSAFDQSGLTSVNIPAAVKTVGNSAFSGCNSLASITLNEGLESIGANAFEIRGSETLDIVLPSTVKSIGERCFNGITANKIIINETIETVGANVVKDAKIKELAAPAMEIGTRQKPDSVLQKVTVLGTADIPEYAYKYCTALKSVTIGNGVKRIGNEAFAGLEELSLGGVEYMGTSALGDISALKYTKTENGVNYIDNWVISSDYSKGDGATGLDLSGVTGIYHNAFKKTDANDTSILTTVALTSSDDTSDIKFIGQNSFYGTGITGVVVPASVQTWDCAFYHSEKLSSVSVQNGVEKIANEAFAYCYNLTGVNLKASDVTEIGAGAFEWCSGLRYFTMPDGIKKIGDYAFDFCSSLMAVDLKGTEEVGAHAFGYCESLGEVVMNSVKKIGGNAFLSTDITEIDLPATVTEIGPYALDDALTVNFAGTAEQWAAIDKGNNGKYEIWSAKNDLTVVFADGGSIVLPKDEK